MTTAYYNCDDFSVTNLVHKQGYKAKDFGTGLYLLKKIIKSFCWRRTSELLFILEIRVCEGIKGPCSGQLL